MRSLRRETKLSKVSGIKPQEDSRLEGQERKHSQDRKLQERRKTRMPKEVIKENVSYAMKSSLASDTAEEYIRRKKGDHLIWQHRG